jgi:ribonuclease BN (tRNA processing enzyme)
MLMQMMYLAGRTNPLHIYLPREGVEGASDWLKQIYMFPEKLPFHCTFSPITPDAFFQDDILRLTAYENAHLQGYREMVAKQYPERSLESYSFLLECNGMRILYSGDLSSLEDLAPHCDHEDMLFLEATHVTIDDILTFITDHHVQRTVLTHIPPELEGKEDLILTTALESGMENLVVANDGLVIPL